MLCTCCVCCVYVACAWCVHTCIHVLHVCDACGVCVWQRQLSHRRWGLGPCPGAPSSGTGPVQIKWPVGYSHLNVILGTVSGAYHGCVSAQCGGTCLGWQPLGPKWGPSGRASWWHVGVAVTSQVARGSTQLTGVWRPWPSWCPFPLDPQERQKVASTWGPSRAVCCH